MNIPYIYWTCGEEEVLFAQLDVWQGFPVDYFSEHHSYYVLLFDGIRKKKVKRILFIYKYSPKIEIQIWHNTDMIGVLKYNSLVNVLIYSKLDMVGDDQLFIW